MLKKVMVFSLTLLALCACSVKREGILNGTYTCEEVPFTTMVFDLEDNQKFYYRTMYTNEEGTYEKTTDTTYTIKSPTFNTATLTFDSKNNMFTMMLGNAEYNFVQVNSLPTIVEE